VVAAVIKDLGLIQMLDARLCVHEPEEITTGAAVAGMLLNGLGFSNRPLSFTPPFVANTPLDLLCRQGVTAERFNRCTLGRRLDEVHADGCDLLLSEVAMAVCAHAGIDQRFTHLDTTRVALTGDSMPESDEHAMAITHGSSKDHRADLQQAVLELMVSQDGGVPLRSKSWEGHASDSQVFQERAEALLKTLQHSPPPRYVVADCQRYEKDTAEHVKSLPCITRIPHTLKVVSQVMPQALAIDTWHDVDAPTRYQRLEVCHSGMAQRWLVVFSQAAAWRAEAAVRQAQHKAYDAMQPQLFPCQAPRFASQPSAYEALSKLGKQWRSHPLDSYAFTAHKRDGNNGRPTPRPPSKATEWQIEAQGLPEAKRINHAKPLGACSGIGSNMPCEQRSDGDVLTGSKAQAQAEGGCRFLKDPLFFVSSLFVKKPSRIQGLLRVMTLALLVSSVTQRRLRQA